MGQAMQADGSNVHDVSAIGNMRKGDKAENACLPWPRGWLIRLAMA